MHHQRGSDTWLDAAPQVLGCLRPMIEGLLDDVLIGKRYGSVILGEGHLVPSALLDLDVAHHAFTSMNERYCIAAGRLCRSLVVLEHATEDFEEPDLADLCLSRIELAIVACGLSSIVLTCDEELKQLFQWQERRADAFDSIAELFSAAILPPSFIYGRLETMELYCRWRNTTGALFYSE